MKQTVLQKALKIGELELTLNNISFDDRRALESYSDAEILAEARYVLSTFHEGGHMNNDDLVCRYGDKAAQREARKQVAALNRLLK